jgi:competence protein ComEC
MNVLTVNVGQGSLAIVRHNKEAIVVDSRIPPSADATVAFVKQIFATALKDHRVKGFILTGFDGDHADVVGTATVLIGLCTQNTTKTPTRRNGCFG